MDFKTVIEGLTTNKVDSKLIEQLEKEEELQKILFNLNNEEKEDLIRKITLFAKSDSKKDTKDKNDVYIPVLNKLDFVHCDFTGVGSEWDGPHYGLVWEVNPRFDAVTIIPATSKKRKNYANIIPVGKILGLPKGDTSLLVSDMTKVSRRRLEPVTFNHYTKGVIRTRLQNKWIPSIVEAVALTYGNETTLEEFITQRTIVSMPEDLEDLRSKRFKPVKARYDRENNIMEYRIWNQDNWHSLNMKNPNTQINKSVKIKLVKELLSEDLSVREEAERKYFELYH
ncbi:hypothetical protein ABEY63_24860 [Priestia aryabhattai]|uniref:hypothetical protein n=1 Tax=Priestia aryabhattai TaxID=412384 RepID=UPI003D2B9100